MKEFDMQHAALAERFDDVGRTLEAGGHRIIIRKARALIEAGDFDAAVEFLEAAARRQRGLSLDKLAEAVTDWATDDGDVDALVAHPKWRRARDREDQISKLIDEATRGDLGALAGALARQQRALADGETIAAVEPSAPVEPVAAEKPAVAEKPITLEKPAVEKPAVEKPADLEAREPVFDDASEATAEEAPADIEAATVPEVAAVDEAPVFTTPEPPAVEKPAVEKPAVEKPAVEKPAVEEPVTEVRPPEVTDVSAPATGGRSMMGPIIIAIGIAAAAAAYFFL
ncbi:MAG: hypothetical protein H6703_06135 [Myxococcales bacterium]|nr:hypothetical protein [Myxococcales bacterium]